MSGGTFNYQQYKIGYIADQIGEIISKNGCEKTREEIKDEFQNSEWYEKYPEERFHYQYREEVIMKMKETIKILRMAEVYAQRVDWLLSGDDGEDTFLTRLDVELKTIEEKFKL
jgi:hypothetical protein